ncbi:MAG: hypothetical protein E2O52_08580, partial [Gammaproteobacteria bacterium]
MRESGFQCRDGLNVYQLLVCCRAKRQMANEPVAVRMLGQDFVVFRDTAGVAYCLSNVCA